MIHRKLSAESAEWNRIVTFIIGGGAAEQFKDRQQHWNISWPVECCPATRSSSVDRLLLWCRQPRITNHQHSHEGKINLFRSSLINYLTLENKTKKSFTRLPTGPINVLRHYPPPPAAVWTEATAKVERRPTWRPSIRSCSTLACPSITTF